MNMYAITYNEYVKDLVIAHDEEEAKQVMLDFNEATMNEVDPALYDSCPITLVPDDMQFMTRKGLYTVRQLIDAHSEPKYWIGIDNNAMQFV